MTNVPSLSDSRWDLGLVKGVDVSPNMWVLYWLQTCGAFYGDVLAEIRVNNVYVTIDKWINQSDVSIDMWAKQSDVTIDMWANQSDVAIDMWVHVGHNLLFWGQ
jgi:hypothetical protein